MLVRSLTARKVVEVSGAGLVEELQALRKGRGALDPKLADNLGEGLRRIWGVSPETDDETVRVKVAKRLDDLSALLPEEDNLRLIFRVVFSLEPGVQRRFIKERRQWLCDKLQYSERTLRHNEETAIKLAVSYLVRPQSSSVVTGHSSVPQGTAADDPFPRAAGLHLDGWYWSSLKVLVQVEGYDRLRLVENHTVVATREQLAGIGLFADVMPGLDGTPIPAELDVWGDRDDNVSIMTNDITRSCRHWKIHPESPPALGERFTFTLIKELAGIKATGFVIMPINRCERLEVDLDFTMHIGLPPAIWRAAGVPPQTVVDYQENYFEQTVQGRSAIANWLNNYCWYLKYPYTTRQVEASATFLDVRPGLAYGLLWRWNYDNDQPFLRFLAAHGGYGYSLKDKTSMHLSLKTPRRPK